MAQKTAGNVEDVKRVVANIRNGLPWHIAKHEKAFMAIHEGQPPTPENSWYEKNKANFYEWAEKGIPVPQDHLTFSRVTRPEPIGFASAGDKTFAIFRNPDGSLYREEVKDGAAPEPPREEIPQEAPVKETPLVMAPMPDLKGAITGDPGNPVPSRRKEKW